MGFDLRGMGFKGWRKNIGSSVIDNGFEDFQLKQLDFLDVEKFGSTRKLNFVSPDRSKYFFCIRPSLLVVGNINEWFISG